MSDNYMQFSESIVNLTPEEEEWVKEELTMPLDREECDYDADKDKAEAFLEQWLKDHPLDDPDNYENWPNFGWKIEDDDSLWLYSEDQGDLENVIIFVQRFLKRWSHKKVFTLTWAGTCSRPMIGEFGGGWLVVSANDVKSGDTWGAAQAAAKELQCTPS